MEDCKGVTLESISRFIQPSVLSAGDGNWAAVRDSLQLDELTWTLNMNVPTSSIVVDQFAIGNLLAPDFPKPTFDADKLAKDFLSKVNSYCQTAILKWSPFWLDDQFKKSSRSLSEKCIIFYRLADFFLALQQCIQPEFTLSTRLLLQRQRFRYIAALQPLEMEQVHGILPYYNQMVREARQAYGKSLLYDADQTELAMLEAETDCEPTLSADAEVEMLLYQPAQSSPLAAWFKPARMWKFSQFDSIDRLFSDLLIRRWMLNRDDLDGAARALQAILIADTRQTNKGGDAPAWLWQIAAFLVRFFNPLLILLAILCTLGMCTGNHPIFIGSLAAAIGLVAIILLPVQILTQKKLYATWQLLYPLALRIPGMGLVGILAVSGLADQYLVFSATAWQPKTSLAAWTLFSLCMVASFAYVTFEAQTRTHSWGEALLRSIQLWLFGWASTLYLSIFNSWLSSIIGVYDCSDMTGKWMSASIGNVTVSVDNILIVGAVSLLVGVFTQIFWEDKAIAEPL